MGRRDRVTNQTSSISPLRTGPARWRRRGRRHRPRGRPPDRRTGRLDRRHAPGARRCCRCCSPDPDAAGLLTMAVGVAAAEACRMVADVVSLLKWPNDLVVVATARSASEWHPGRVDGGRRRDRRGGRRARPQRELARRGLRRAARRPGLHRHRAQPPGRPPRRPGGAAHRPAAAARPLVPSAPGPPAVPLSLAVRHHRCPGQRRPRHPARTRVRSRTSPTRAACSSTWPAAPPGESWSATSSTSDPRTGRAADWTYGSRSRSSSSARRRRPPRS
jgi:hypothetical protein